MNLQNLTLDQLHQLQEGIDALAKAGAVLEKAGLDPIFDLTPGEAVCIYPGLDVPPIRDELPAQEIPAAPAPRATPAGPAPRATVDRRTAEAAGPVAGGKVDALAASSDPKPEPVVSSTELVTGPLTDVERKKIVDLAEQGVSRPDIADQIGRKVQTVALFLSKIEKLSPDQLAAPTAAPESAPEAPPADIEAPSPAAILAPNALVLDELGAYLVNVPRKNGWTLELDAELMRLACLGWKAPEIEQELGREGAMARFDLLTCARRFGRDQVANRLDDLTRQAA
jgi:hypothetical protein